MAHTPDGEMTIDELARRAGMTVRNVRAHQSRGLLPPPEVRGRTGWYGAEHLARLQLITELQADGFNLEAIRRLLESAGGSTTEVLRFTRSLRSAFEDEEPEAIELGELAERFGTHPSLLDRSIALGLLRPLGGDRFEARSPRLVAAAEEFVRLGVDAERAEALLGRMHASAGAVADGYVELFLEEIWRPFDEAGRPAERWGEVEETLERLRPLAAEALVALFGIVMSERVEQAIAERISAEPRPRVA